MENQVLALSKMVKLWILITLFSLLTWTGYWIPSSIDRFFGMDGRPWNIIIQNGGTMLFMMEIGASVGTFFQFAAVILAVATLIFLIKKTKTVLDARKWIASSLFLESTYYLLLVPSVLFMMGVGNNFNRNPSLSFLSVDYLLMVLFTAPFMVILGLKVYKYKGAAEGFMSWTWAGVAFVGYVASLWVNSVIKWISMVSLEGLAFFFSGIRSIGALNALILMSSALFFSGLGAYALSKKNFSSALRWIAVTFVLIGLHYAIFVAYSYAVGISNFLILSEIWAIPLFGLGLGIILTKSSSTPVS